VLMQVEIGRKANGNSIALHCSDGVSSRIECHSVWCFLGYDVVLNKVGFQLPDVKLVCRSRANQRKSFTLACLLMNPLACCKVTPRTIPTRTIYLYIIYINNTRCLHIFVLFFLLRL